MLRWAYGALALSAVLFPQLNGQRQRQNGHQLAGQGAASFC
jgi:hypothetical protein